MKSLLIFILLVGVLLSSSKKETLKGAWLNLDSGAVETLNESDKNIKRFGADLLSVQHEKTTDRYIKLDRNSRFNGNVFMFENGKSVSVAKAEIMLISLQNSNIFETQSDASGSFIFNQIPIGSYKLKITKENKRFISDIKIGPNVEKKRFYLRADNVSNYYIINNTPNLLINNGLNYKLDFTIVNNGKRSEKICLDFVFDKSLIKAYKLEKSCMTVQRRKAIPIALEITLNEINSKFDKLNVGVSIDNKSDKWHDFISIPLFYKTKKIYLAAKDKETNAYVITPENEVLQFEKNEQFLEFPVYPSKEYRIVVAGIKKDIEFDIDIGYDKNISTKIDYSDSVEYPFMLKRSVYNQTMGKLLEYSFKAMDNIIMDEDSHGITVPVLMDNIHKISLNNPKLANVKLKNNKIHIKPYRDMHGSSLLYLYSRDENGNEIIKKEFYLKINNVNDEPVIVFEPKRLLSPDEYYSYVFKVFDVDNDTVIKRVLKKPDWLRYDESTGELSGIVEQYGDKTLILEASDNTTKVIKKTRFTIIAQSDNAYQIYDTPASIEVQSTFAKKEPKAESKIKDIQTTEISENKDIQNPLSKKDSIIQEIVPEPGLLKDEKNVETEVGEAPVNNELKKREIKKEQDIQETSSNDEPVIQKEIAKAEPRFYVLKEASEIFSMPEVGVFARWPKHRLIEGVFDAQSNNIKVSRYLKSSGWKKVNDNTWIPAPHVYSGKTAFFKAQEDTFATLEDDENNNIEIKKGEMILAYKKNGVEGTLFINKSFKNGKWESYKRPYLIKQNILEEQKDR